ncbi:AraC family transcriptional regulator [Sporomusa termitida]|uniref:HTH-type transcriptional activator RhaR n=1 Tax=Sporomusa termitida TaxID=2377 RepID=A0A517DQF1_9FIRM|nr:AraC family transcriptional regulator [Sporomusa termitida]QDR79496.1 HTH-type transcriptional activator RhaR [Sporomusa termitida]
MSITQLNSAGLAARLGYHQAGSSDGLIYSLSTQHPGINSWIRDIFPAAGLLATTTYAQLEEAITLIYTLPQSWLYLLSLDSGAITIHENGKKARRLQRGIHLLVYREKAVRMMFQPAERLIYTAIAVSGEFLAAYLNSHPLERPFTVQDAARWEKRHYDAPDIQLVFEQLKAAVRNDKLSPMYYESKMIEILALIRRNIQDEYSWKRHQKSERKSHVTYQNYIYLERVKAELDKNILQAPTIGQLALVAGMSVPKLYRCFKEQYKMTIAGYVRREKMKYAMRLLWNDGLSIQNIAVKVGYENSSKFSAAFKRVHGFPPRHFRKSFGL